MTQILKYMYFLRHLFISTVHESLRLLFGDPTPVLRCAVVSFLDKRQLREPSSQVLINHTAISGRSFDVDISHERSSGFLAHVQATERKW